MSRNGLAVVSFGYLLRFLLFSGGLAVGVGMEMAWAIASWYSLMGAFHSTIV